MARKKKEQDLARELFLNTDRSQKDIAEIVGVSQKAVSGWATDGHWAEMKKMREQTPERIVSDLYRELDEINTAIKNREAGTRFATSAEADARRKIISSIKDMMKEVTLPQYVHVIVALMDYLQNIDLEAAKLLTPLANDFLLKVSSDQSN